MELTTLQGQQSHYDAIRERLRNPPNAFRVAPPRYVAPPKPKPINLKSIKVVYERQPNWAFVTVFDSAHSTRQIRITDVVFAVCMASGIDRALMFADGREAVPTIARQAAMLLCRDLTGRSSTHIGRHMGDRDHSTVISAWKRTGWRCREDAEFAQKYAEIEASLKGAI